MIYVLKVAFYVSSNPELAELFNVGCCTNRFTSYFATGALCLHTLCSATKRPSYSMLSEATARPIRQWQRHAILSMHFTLQRLQPQALPSRRVATVY